MIEFVNAKINIGLQIVERRSDGYHNLETIFYPIGKRSGLPVDPYPFCDILEVLNGIVPHSGSSRGGTVYVETYKGVKIKYIFTGLPIDCNPEDNLVCRGARAVIDRSNSAKSENFTVLLDKHILFGAGVGGGSADVMFLVKALNKVGMFGLTEKDIYEISMELGSDTTFFLYNEPAFMEGKGENLTPVSLPQLKDCWLVLCNPGIHVSTKEAFSKVTPHSSEYDLLQLPDVPLSEWKEIVRNDFEDSVFPLYPAIKQLKDELYSHNAIYASMSGSGSSVYGIYTAEEEARESYIHFKENSTLSGVSLLSL